jgi:hypothetical protein
MISIVLESISFILTPKHRKALRVDQQSAPLEKFEIIDFPFAIEANIIALCEIDLSAGIVISPFKFLILETRFIIATIVAYY